MQQLTASLSAVSDFIPKEEAHLWDIYKRQTRKAAAVFAKHGDAYYSNRMLDCANNVGLAPDHCLDGIERLRPWRTFLCGLSACPLCQWRKACRRRAQFLPIARDLAKQYSSLFALTLTVRNCVVGDLRRTIDDLTGGYERMVRRKSLKSLIKGWLRSTEVTRGDDGSAHPHFHSLLALRGGFLAGQDRLSQSDWAGRWADSMRLDYEPTVSWEPVEQSQRALCYLFKCTPEQLEGILADEDFYMESTHQLHNVRMVSSGGAFYGPQLQGAKTERPESNMFLFDRGNRHYALAS